MLQTILFRKDKWRKSKALKWLKDRNLKYDVDETDRFYRFRQTRPQVNKKYHTITKDGIDFVFMI